MGRKKNQTIRSKTDAMLRKKMGHRWNQRMMNMLKEAKKESDPAAE